jgi:hypothetical protein
MSGFSDEKCARCGKYSPAGTSTCPDCGARLPASSGASATQGAAPSKSRWRFLWWLAIPALFVFMIWPGSVEGTLRSRGQPFGDREREFSACYSGDRQNYFGVALKPEDRSFESAGGVKILKNAADQWLVYVERPLGCAPAQCELVELDRKQCSVFEVDVRNSGMTVNEIRGRTGRAKLECRFPEGGTLSAALEFSGCT